jgi:leucyl/phenylalanyl-tRNA--protein transferase
MTAPYLLDNTHKTLFPMVEFALAEPNGLLAVGGDLCVERLTSAYKQGIFPWYSGGQPILWWSPDPRMVLPPRDINVSRSLAKKIRQQHFRITLDQQFSNVIIECSQPRLVQGQRQSQTWILDEMISAYIRLHEAGYAHSVECWQADKLVGGLYGVAIGKIFFGESMFSRESDASKISFVYLAKQLERWGYKLIDCQVYTSHLASLGASMIDRKDFIHLLQQYTPFPVDYKKWRVDPDISQYVMNSLVNKNE